MLTFTDSIREFTYQLAGLGPEVNTECLEHASMTDETSFTPGPVFPDGEGGFYLRRDDMLVGLLYPIVIDGVSLVAVREPDDSIVLYGLPT